MCPTTYPWEPPENLPSVSNDHTFPRPAPIIALVGVSISGMPGPPLGPSPLMTTTFPCKLIGSSEIAVIMDSSPSKTRAGPRKNSPSFPVIFATEPSGARLPYNI
nr:Uncharacterised protein [Ipomoea batatas]